MPTGTGRTITFGTLPGRILDHIWGQIGRGGVRFSLVMRVVPLVQATVTLSWGFGVYWRPWLGVSALVVAFGWSAGFTAWAWRRRCPGWMYGGDCLVAVVVLVVAGASVPASLLTTSFYWAASFAAVVALTLGIGLPPGRAGLGLLVLVAGYGVVVRAGAGSAALPPAAGTAMGMVAYFGCGVAIAGYLRRFAGTVSTVSAAVAARAAELSSRRARVEEFSRLHDEAVQVLELVAVGAPDSLMVRAYAARAATRLRRHIAGADSDDSVDAGLRELATEFAAFGLDVTVERVGPMPVVSDRAGAVVLGAVTEALHNVAKHAGTERVWIRVISSDDGVEVTVTDHGRGFDVTAIRPGFGLANSIQRRVREAGGRVDVTTAPGTGTAVRIWLPQ